MVPRAAKTAAGVVTVMPLARARSVIRARSRFEGIVNFTDGKGLEPSHPQVVCIEMREKSRRATTP